MQSLNHKSYHKFYRPGCHHPRVAQVQFPIWAKLPLSEVELDQFGPSSRGWNWINFVHVGNVRVELGQFWQCWHYPMLELRQFGPSWHYPRVELDLLGPSWHDPRLELVEIGPSCHYRRVDLGQSGPSACQNGRFACPVQQIWA